jgi:hypothetical protein
MRIARRHSRGFSLLEVVVAMGLTLALGLLALRTLASARDLLSVGLDAVDVQQRLRVALMSLTNAVERAGTPERGGPQPSAFLTPHLLPFRIGAVRPDLAGVYRDDVLTTVQLLGARSRLAEPMATDAGSVVVETGAGCAAVPVPCGFARDMHVLIADGTGAFDLFVVEDVVGAVLQVEHLFPDHPRGYRAGASVSAVETHTYFLGADARTGVSSLKHYDGGPRGDVPVADHVVGLRFDYWGERLAPSALLVAGDPEAYWSTYGPAPPALRAPTVGYPSGENCMFARDGAAEPTTRLATLGAADGVPGLVRLAPADLTDGPWCPDDSSGRRYDADLLRIRAVEVWLRVEAADDARGPQSLLFRNGGRALRASRWVRDAEVRVRVTPRNVGEVQ